MRNRIKKGIPRALLPVLVVFIYGALVGHFQLFPYNLFSLAAQGYHELGVKSGLLLPWYYRPMRHPYPASIRNTSKAYQGLNLITRFTAGMKLSVEIITMDGKRIHEWDIDWFKLWSDATHLPEDKVPISRPGTQVHGAALMENGDLVFNFEHLGLVRLHRDGDVVWRLPYRTHHSIHIHDDGNIWVCGEKERKEPNPYFPHRIPPFDEYTLLEVSPAGKILREWSIPEVLRKNDLSGLLSMSVGRPGDEDNAPYNSLVRDDRLHLNDVEPFSASLGEGFFTEGDVLVSLRNINTVFVFNHKTLKIKFISVGRFIGQHDPDFIDGNSFSVLDNNTISSAKEGPHSRIVIVSAKDHTFRTVFEGTSQTPFYTNILGKHQSLPNGNLLISDSVWGRAFEINRQGEIVWEYTNYVDDGVVGVVQEVQRLPLEYSAIFSQGPSGAQHGASTVRHQNKTIKSRE